MAVGIAVISDVAVEVDVDVAPTPVAEEVAVAEASTIVGRIEVAVLVACTGVLVELTAAVLVRVGVGVAVLPPGVTVVVGEEQVPLTAVKVILELVAGAVLHTYCVKPPAPFCTPIVEVASVLSVPRIISKLEVASYNLISK
jgi:hypothetical protein